MFHVFHEVIFKQNLFKKNFVFMKNMFAPLLLWFLVRLDLLLKPTGSSLCGESVSHFVYVLW